MENNGIWQEAWKVAAFMVDASQQIRLKSIGDIFQELANSHANFRNIGFERMKKSNRFWVLNRQAMHIQRWPKWEEKLKVESWISMMKGPFSLRHFAAIDVDQQPIIVASYLWTSIGRDTKRPIVVPEGEFPVVENRPFDLPEAVKIRVDGDEIKTSTYTVRDSDLDIIGHTNNAIYLEWVENILKSEKIEFSQIQSNYVGESFVGDHIKINLLKSDDHHAVEVLNGDKQIFRARIS